MTKNPQEFRDLEEELFPGLKISRDWFNRVTEKDLQQELSQVEKDT